MTRARDIANFGDGIATADIGDGQITTAKIASGAITDALLPTGSVLQVVQGTTSSPVNVTSTSFVDSGLSASITPSSASNKILVIASISADYIRQANTINYVEHNIVRNSTQLTAKRAYNAAGVSSSSYVYFPHLIVVTYLDSPNTTSSVTYKVQGRVDSNASNTELRYQIGSSTSVIHLMEIAG